MVYVDYDPIVIAHSRELLSGVDNAIVIQADVRQPDEIIGNPKVRRLIDFDQPVAVLLGQRVLGAKNFKELARK